MSYGRLRKRAGTSRELGISGLLICARSTRYLAVHHPEMLGEAQRVEAIPTRRVQAAKTVCLERDEMSALFQTLPKQGNLDLRDRALLMFVSNTGARVQDIDFEEPFRVRLHGKGDKRRCCPIWPETAQLLKQPIVDRKTEITTPVFVSQQRKPLTRFGIYKIVKRYTARLQCSALGKTHSGLFRTPFAIARRSIYCACLPTSWPRNSRAARRSRKSRTTMT